MCEVMDRPQSYKLYRGMCARKARSEAWWWGGGGTVRLGGGGGGGQ